jgi:hypothetical protein
VRRNQPTASGDSLPPTGGGNIALNVQRSEHHRALRDVLRSGFDEHIPPGFHPERGFSGVPLLDDDDEQLHSELLADPELRELVLRSYAERAQQAEELMARAPSYDEQLSLCPVQRANLPPACQLVSANDCTKFICMYHALPDGGILEGEDRRQHLEAAHNISTALRAANLTAAEHARDPQRYLGQVHIDLDHHVQRRAYTALVDESYSILGYNLVIQVGYDLCASPIYFKIVFGFFVKKFEASIEFAIPGLSIKYV